MSGQQRELSDEAVDALLAGVADAAREFMVESAAAERDAERWNDECERFIGQQGSAGSGSPDPRAAVASLRRQMTAVTDSRLREVAREWVAWWADVATYAVGAASAGLSVDRARVVAVAPCGWWSAEGATCLPDPPEHVVRLVRLTSSMAGAPLAEDPSSGRDLLAQAQELAASYGLDLQWSDGEVDVVDGIGVENHRRRMWGEIWTDYRLPLIPEVEHLEKSLVECGTPDAAVWEIHEATAGVVKLWTAALRLSELNAVRDEEDTPELGLSTVDVDALYDQLDQATAVIAAYAGALTTHLPVIRAARRASGLTNG